MARPPGQLGPPKKSGGRVRGSLDASQRKVVTEQMAQNILDVFNGLGGLAWLLEWAKANQTQFITVCLARLFPAFPKENPDIQINTQINHAPGGDDNLDAARRIAFVLAQAAAQLDEVPQELAPYTYTPARPYDRDCDPQAACRADPDPARDAWAADLQLTEDEKLIKETSTASLENYRGGAGEGLVDRPTARRKRSLL